MEARTWIAADKRGREKSNRPLHREGQRSVMGIAEATAFAVHMAGPVRIGLGCMALTGLYGYISVDQATATIHRALSMGVRLFDTAPIYGDGTNEDLLGRALAGQSDVFITTKFGLVQGEGGQLIRDSNPSGIRLSVERSLRRLRRERIDLLLQHRHDPRTRDDDVVGVVADLICEGKVDVFGLSSTDAARAAAMNCDHPVRAVQNELSIISPAAADAMPGAFGAIGATYMAYSPLGRGVLTSTAKRRAVSGADYRARLELFKGEDSKAMSSVFATVGEVAARHGVGRAAVSLAWLLACGTNVVAIPGSRWPEQVDAALETSRVTLEVADLRMLNGVSAKFGLDCVGNGRPE